jgi:hypothetical protein
MMSESRVMSDVVSFFLIVVDEDRKQFAVEGPLTDHKPWSRAIAAAQGEGRKIRCCNISEKTRTDTIAVWRRQGGARSTWERSYVYGLCFRWLRSFVWDD